MLYIRCESLVFNYNRYRNPYEKYRCGIEFAPEVVQADGNVGHQYSLVFK